MDILRVAPTSLASSSQRAGRAGRTSAGKCLRLYPESSLAQLAPSTPPEICRSDVSLFILQLKALGIDNVVRWDFMTPPPAKMLERGLEFLYSLGALDEMGRLTPELGSRMAEVGRGVPLHAGCCCCPRLCGSSDASPLALGNSSPPAACRPCDGKDCTCPKKHGRLYAG